MTTRSQTASPNLILGICCLSLLVVGMDVTIVNVALPAIQHDLRASLAQLQWIVDAYTLVVASLLVLAGSVSDRFGRRRIFQLGLILFTSASLLCSLAPDIGALITFRALQGVGASMLNPVALSIIANSFNDPKARARAVGIWGAVAGVSLAIGPLLGGALTELVGWRSIFWINVPIGLAAVVLAARFVPESKALHPRRFDPVGQILVLLALAALIYSVIEGPRAGWRSAEIVDLFGASGILLILFLIYESRVKKPLLDLRFFRSVPFSSAAVLAFLGYASFGGFLFLNALYLQQARGLSAFYTDVCTLPLAVMMIFSAPLSGKLVGIHGTRPSLLASGLTVVLSALLLTQLTIATPMALLLVSYALFGFGLGMINPAITNSAVSGMPLSQAGVAAAIASTGRQVGVALGVAVSGTVVGASRANGIPFTAATVPMWWTMAAIGAFVVLTGLFSNTNWAKRSTEEAATLMVNDGA